MREGKDRGENARLCLKPLRGEQNYASDDASEATDRAGDGPARLDGTSIG
jgi:hypothetical protein